ncbi:MAG: hypothetical protein FJZ38_14420 [Candidatus Rokubacteria bacterium]|nr:hypothetical protein [Candidatus Rokubacteria bacterium]
MTRTYAVAALLAATCLGLAVTGSAGPVPDRLERFRALVSERLSPAQILDVQAAEEAYREAYALLDEEIVESLGSGGVFASTAFLQDRLDAFSDAWGGAAVRIVRLGQLTVGVFQLEEPASVTSVRVYGKLREEAALLSVLEREGRPTLYPLPGGPGGVVQFLVAWDGTPPGRGGRPLRLDVARQRADGVHVVWSTADVYPDGLIARNYAVRGAEVRVRYELRYPGWVPGCEGQTEQEDAYRFTPATGTYTRLSQRQFDAWHRDMHAAAARLFAALEAQDRRTVAALVPDARVRERLPARLTPEPVCDATAGARSEQVLVAATDGQGSPWTVTFQRGEGARWRVVGASPVIP